MRKDVKSQTEKAFVAYMEANQASTVLSTCNVYAGGLMAPVPVKTPPYVCFTAASPEQFGYDSGIYELTLRVCIATQVDDEMQISEANMDVHRERIEALRDMIEDVPLLQSQVNAPASGTDTRTVQDFTLSCLVYNNDDETKTEDRKLVTDWTYCVTASPSD